MNLKLITTNRKLLSARERRLRLATYGNPISGKEDVNCVGSGKMAILTESYQMNKQLQNVNLKTGEASNGVIVETTGRSNDTSQSLLVANNDIRRSHNTDNKSVVLSQEGSNGDSRGGSRIQLDQQRNSSCATDPEFVAISCNSSASSLGANKKIEFVDLTKNNNQQSNQARILTQLIVEKTPTSAAISTTTVSTKMLASCDRDQQIDVKSAVHNLEPGLPYNEKVESSRSASTCGALELYSGTTATTETRLCDSQQLVQASRATSQDFPGKTLNISMPCNRRSLGGAINLLSDENLKYSPDKRSSETNNVLNGSRSTRGSAALTPIQIVKLQAAQRQLSQNETTTRLLIAVMIVFLICEFPAGILAALCAVLGESFFENVYQPTGILTDLLALINSSVNFILYCFMSTQFRTTFYKVVLHC